MAGERKESYNYRNRMVKLAGPEIKVGDKINFVVISCDLPFGQKRWCGMANVDKAHVYSDHRDRSFGQAYGVYVKETGFLWRAVFVLDKDGVVRYAEYAPEMGQHPNYEKILETARQLSV